MALIKRILIFLLSLVFIIIFFSVTTSLYANDIKKFKIEGMSLGDSVIDHFAGRDVVNNIISSNDNRSDEFHISSFYKHKNFTKFDEIYLTIQSKSEEILFPIGGISGIIFFKQNIEECYVEKDKLVKELGTIFKKEIESGITKVKRVSKAHPGDLSGRSHYEQSEFFFPWGYARVTCYDMGIQSGSSDALAIDIFTNEVDEWLQMKNA